MIAIIKSAFFQIAVVPLALMVVGVFANQLGRRDGDDSPTRNDWAVNTTLLLMVLGAILGDLGDNKLQLNDVVNLFGWLVGVLVAAFASLSYDRYSSWERDPTTKAPLKAKSIWLGIIVPDLAALVIFAAFQAHKAQLI